jgi:carbamoylphosphate synthase large subunit
MCVVFPAIVADVILEKQVDSQEYVGRSKDITFGKVCLKNQHYINVCSMKATKYVGRKQGPYKLNLTI